MTRSGCSNAPTMYALPLMLTALPRHLGLLYPAAARRVIHAKASYAPEGLAAGGNRPLSPRAASHWCARGADTDGDPSGKFFFGSWPRTSDENDRPTGDNAATGRPSPDKPDRRRGARADWYTGARRSS